MLVLERVRVAGVIVVCVAGCRSQYPYCEETAHVLAGLDDKSPEGVAAADLLALAGGEHDPRLCWQPWAWADPARATTSPTLDKSAFRFTVSYEGGEVRYVESERVEPKFGPVDDMAIDCHPRVEVDVEAVLRTEEGALDETWTLPLFQELMPDWDETGPVSLDRNLDPKDIQGSLELVAFDPPDPDDVLLLVGITFDEDGSHGDIEVQLTYEHGDYVSATSFTLAAWSEGRALVPDGECGELLDVGNTPNCPAEAEQTCADLADQPEREATWDVVLRSGLSDYDTNFRCIELYLDLNDVALTSGAVDSGQFQVRATYAQIGALCSASVVDSCTPSDLDPG
jgi:hypothetical protein